MDHDTKETLAELMTYSFEKSLRNSREHDVIEVNHSFILKIDLSKYNLPILNSFDRNHKLFIRLLQNNSNSVEDFLETKYICEIMNTLHIESILSIGIRDIEKIYFNDMWINAFQENKKSPDFYYPSRHTLKHLDIDFSIKIGNERETFWVRLVHFMPIFETDGEEKYLENDCYGIIMNELSQSSRYNFLNFVYFKIKNIYYVIDSKDRNEYEHCSGLLPGNEPFINSENIVGNPALEYPI